MLPSGTRPSGALYSDGGGSEANFGSSTTLQAQTALTATSNSAPTCVEEGFTGETNILSGRPVLAQIRASEPGEVIEVDRENKTKDIGKLDIALPA